MSTTQKSRRQFLQRVAMLPLVATSIAAARDVSAPWTSAQESPVTATIGSDTFLKFNRDGTPRTFRGNTLICHLPQQSRFHDALAALSGALGASAFGKKLAMLPLESFHMTVFPGANDLNRDVYGWPSDVSKTASIEECTRIVGERAKAFRLNTQLPIRMHADGERLIGSIRLSPINADEGLRLRHLRDRLAAEVFHFLDEGHDTYTFHSTLAYQLERLTPDEEREHQALLVQYMPRVMETGNLVELGNPEFCAFDSMAKFDPLVLLQT